MAKPSKGGVILLTLFGLPFLGMGLLFVFAQVSKYKTLDSLNVISSVIYGLAFAGFGGGLIYAAFAGNSRLKKQAEIEAAHPQTPWLWRPDWAERRAKSHNKDSQIGWWVAAIFCSMIFLPFVAMIAQKYRGNGDPGIFVAIGLSLAATLLITGAVRATIRRQRFGDAYFEFDALPFSPGERVSGRIHLRLDTRVQHGVTLRLECARTIRTGSGDDSTTRRVILWQEKNSVPSEGVGPGPLGRAIPVEFELPPDAHSTTHQNFHDQVAWTLYVRADVPGVDYTDKFEIPVFGAAKSALHADAHAQVGLPLGAAPQPSQGTDGSQIFRSQRRTSSAGSIALFVMIAVAMFGWQAWRMASFRSRANGTVVAAKTRPGPVTPRVFSGPMTDADVTRILAQPPQMQAEELLERAIGHDARALHLLNEQVPEWTGLIQRTDRMGQLERRSEFSKDLRVRQANVDLNLALEGWHKNQESVDALIERAQTDPQYRAWAVYYLGMLAGRDVDYDRVHGVILVYARNDKNPYVRQWAVEGMRFLGTDEALDELFVSFTEDPSTAVRNRAGCNVSDCGIFTRKQRMRMVPKFLELVRNPQTSAQMRNWSFLALQEITDENLPADAMAWSRWYEEHGDQKMAELERLDWWQVRGDE